MKGRRVAGRGTGGWDEKGSKRAREHAQHHLKLAAITGQRRGCASWFASFKDSGRKGIEDAGLSANGRKGSTRHTSNRHAV